MAENGEGVSNHRTTRRRFLQLAAGATVASQTPLAAGAGEVRERRAELSDGVLLIEFDPTLRSRLSNLGAGRRRAITPWTSSEYLRLSGGEPLDHFVLRESTREAADGPHGKGTRLKLLGVSPQGIEKRVEVTLVGRYPGVAFYRVAYRNRSSAPVALAGWTNSGWKLLSAAAQDLRGPQFWSYCGSTHADRRDWVQPVTAGFAQDNFMGMTASDYGGGTPVVDVWRADCGLAVGHLATIPRLVSLPVKHTPQGATLAVSAREARVLQPGESLDTLETFVALHRGDYFAALASYRRIMAERGVKSPPSPAAAYEPIWCAWGYERECTVKLIEDTLPKVEELGLRWAVIDDGWQSNVGDWDLNRAKFPHGAADMQQLVARIRARSLKSRLWYAPLAAAPGSDLLHDHTDMLLLDKDGAVQNVSWWNSFYLCPAYTPTVDHTVALVRRFMGEWGLQGLKVDGQHLNGVAPCYNPAHHHARPEESVERLPEFMQEIYRTATTLDPEAVVEVCPCGTAYSFFNFASMNQAPASDPESSWQVRHKGKTLKALMGPSAAFAGDHVELSDGGDDFASTVGIGAIVSTKFTWPVDPKPKDSFLLTPQREALWRRWIALYNERLLPQGIYRGELYDIGFDKPETHVVEKSGRLYYAFYARRWSGPVALRGLTAGRYRVRDYFNDRELGHVSQAQPHLSLAFERFQVLEAIPL
ncbi:MAG: alpha-galactosidase [Gammaproteobacteria bacterium]|nr:MAG: alpha-galactosidase [Gammaproteobacteria bacterium]TLZ45563.1 MAG: alpha-galactosidase [Gammaproteobacteria bacterium]